jgi:hypothetical protein
LDETLQRDKHLSVCQHCTRRSCLSRSRWLASCSGHWDGRGFNKVSPHFKPSPMTKLPPAQREKSVRLVGTDLESHRSILASLTPSPYRSSFRRTRQFEFESETDADCNGVQIPAPPTVLEYSMCQSHRRRITGGIRPRSSQLNWRTFRNFFFKLRTAFLYINPNPSMALP